MVSPPGCATSDDRGPPSEDDESPWTPYAGRCDLQPRRYGAGRFLQHIGERASSFRSDGSMDVSMRNQEYEAPGQLDGRGQTEPDPVGTIDCLPRDLGAEAVDRFTGDASFVLRGRVYGGGAASSDDSDRGSVYLSGEESEAEEVRVGAMRMTADGIDCDSASDSDICAVGDSICDDELLAIPFRNLDTGEVMSLPDALVLSANFAASAQLLASQHRPDGWDTFDGVSSSQSTTIVKPRSDGSRTATSASGVMADAPPSVPVLCAVNAKDEDDEDAGEIMVVGYLWKRGNTLNQTVRRW